MFDAPKRPAAELGRTQHEEPAPARDAGTARGEGFTSGTASNPSPAPPTLDPTKKATPTAGPVKVVVSSETKQVMTANPRSRTTVAIGEKVTFYAEQDAAGSGIGIEGTWSSTVGTTAPNAADGNMLWTAPDAQAAGGVTFTPKDGGTATTIQMKVVEPSNLKFVLKDEIKYPKGQQGAGMHLDVFVEPAAASFQGMAWKEGVVDPTNVTGYYTGKAKAHVPASPSPTFNQDNQIMGDKGGGDTAEFAGASSPWTQGGYDWLIPQAVVYNGKEFPMKSVLQTCRMKDGGETTTTKNGISVTRAP